MSRQLLSHLVVILLLLQPFALISVYGQKRPSPTTNASRTSRNDVPSPNAGSTTVVISQVYGGGGATSGTPTYKADYVELFNLSSSAVNLSGHSIQYGSSTGNFTSVYAIPSGTTIQPGKYLLVQVSTVGTAGSDLPVTPDLTTTTLNMSAASGKVALASVATALGCGATATPCALPHANIVDLVAYGASNNAEGGASVNNGTALTNQQGGVRKSNGCQDTDNNNNDFNVVTNPVPRNSSSAANSCGGGGAQPSLSINDVTLAEGDSGTTTFTFTVSLSAPAPTGGVSFNIATADGTTNPATVADNDYIARSLTGQTIASGNQTYSFDVSVVGDTTPEPNETFFVNVSNVSGATVSDGQGLGTIQNDDIALTLISAVQGSGTASPLAGTSVSVRGIVTLLRSNGFFIQEEDADADADVNTSEGIFVFTSAAPTVAVGDQATVTGNVIEFNSLTEISTTNANVIVNSTGNTLPTAVTLTIADLPPTAPHTQPQLEKYEGMRLAAASLRTVAPNDNFFDVYTVFNGPDLFSIQPRPFREPGIPVNTTVPPDPSTGTPDCCVPRFDLNPERLKIDTNGRAGATGMTLTSDVALSNVIGPLDFSFGEYRLIPQADPTVTSNMAAVPVPVPGLDEFTIASFNIENFNNAATQRAKASLAIRNVLRYPDIIGLQEIFELSGLQALATQINNDAVANGDPNPLYEARLVEGNGVGGDNDQDVGFLVKTARVQINSTTQERAADTFINPNTGNPEKLHDRPPFVLNATVDPSGANPMTVIVVVNHLRSFIDIDQDPGDGPRVRAKRTKQAESLASLLQELQTNNPTTPVVSVGDYNAYEFNDGYTDPMSIIKGAPTSDDEVVVDQSPDLVNPNFTNLTDTLTPDQRYTFIFEGNPQALDHVLVNSVANTRVSRYAVARSNADFPSVPSVAFASNATRPERASDHDMPVAYFSLGQPQPQGSVVISEFRFRGTGNPPMTIEGADTIGAPAPPASNNGGGTNIVGNTPADLDEFVEIYNNTDSPITVSTTDGSEGWALVAADGIIRFVVPNGTVIPARGHFLGTNSGGYSLKDYGCIDCATGDIQYSLDIPNESGIALFRTSNSTNFIMSERLDAAGYNTVDALYREGAGFPTGGAETTQDIEYSFLRSMTAASGGRPKDTGDNLADFIGVDTQGFATGLGTKLGAPGPENLLSPIQRNAAFPASLLDPSVGSSQPPNRARDFTPVSNGNEGTLSIRRTFTNNTGASVSFLVFRIVNVTTFAPPDASTADLRALTSSDFTATVNGNPVDVRGLTLEEPPFQPNGGGWNSSLVVFFNPSLAPGDSVAVDFRLGVMQRGAFRFLVNIETVEDPPNVVAPQSDALNVGRPSRGQRR